MTSKGYAETSGAHCQTPLTMESMPKECVVPANQVRQRWAARADMRGCRILRGTEQAQNLVAPVVQNSNGLMTMAGMLLPPLVADDAARTRMSKIQPEFADCLPSLHRRTENAGETYANDTHPTLQRQCLKHAVHCLTRLSDSKTRLPGFLPEGPAISLLSKLRNNHGQCSEGRAECEEQQTRRTP